MCVVCILQNLQYGLVLTYSFGNLKNDQAGKDCDIKELSGKLANEEKNVAELKQKLLEHEVSLKRLTKEKDECIKQLEEEVKDHYCIGWARTRLDSLRAFRDGLLVPAEVEAEISRIADLMSDEEEEVESK